MKLSSSARLRIVAVAITTILTATIGGSIARQGYLSAVSTVDKAINATIADAAQSPHQELSAALFHIQEYALDVSLFLVARDGSVTTVNESTIHVLNEISLKDAIRAIDKTVAGHDLGDYRYRSLMISGGDYLVVAAPANEAIKNLHTNVISVAATTAVMSLFSYFILSFYTRRLQRRDNADALARMQTFLGDASHELRTPLTVVKGYVEMLSKGQLTSEADRTRAFSRVNSEIGRMESLIHDLLLLAELGESGQRDQEVVNLSEVISVAIEDFRTLNSKREIALAIDSEAEIVIVRDHILRFIQNALNNISRHTPEDAPVGVSLRLQGKNVELVIEDGGAGLPESAYRENIQSLKRFDQSRSRESGGSGLGMSIMAGVVSKAGGELSLRKSALGGLAIVAKIPSHHQ